jgi:hypothetical protein
MKCPNCGLLNAANARFCGNCGTAFGAPNTNPGNPNPGGTYMVNPPPQRGGLTAGSVGRGCLIAFAIVVLLLLFSGRSCFSHRRHVRYGYRTQLVLPVPSPPHIYHA